MIKSITILGAGTMGRGIAWFFSQRGINTTLFDPYDEALKLAREKLEDNRSLKFTINLQDAVSNADLIIESIPEVLEIKKQLYSDIAPFLKPEAVVASNTSTFPLSVLSEGQIFADRMIITHFFNPAELIPLVEIVNLPHTQKGLPEKITGFFKQNGKVPVLLKRDIKGFIANRLQAAVLREACYLVEQGIAEAGDIDTVMKESIGTRWALSGPFEIADFGGLDIWEKVLNNLLPVLDSGVEAPVLISQKVNEHNLGLKTGKGFFTYDQNSGKKRAEDWAKKLGEIITTKKG